MSRRARTACFVFLCLLSCFWALLVLSASSVRFANRDLILTLRAGTVAPQQVQISAAIADYEHVMRLRACDAGLQHERVLLRARMADDAIAAPDAAAADEALKKMQEALKSLLSCMPTDGKAWLDLATVTIWREGLTPDALAAYVRSASVSPGESWLAEKRLLFALKFRPLLPVRARSVALADIRVLERAHPNRITEIIKAAQTESAATLAALFTGAAQ